jgi:ubiquinone/menaquinone biosynthesis C-methylase UbiE
MDAPDVVRNFGLAAGGCLTLRLVFLVFGQRGVLGILLRDMALGMGIAFLLMMRWMYWGLTRGQLRDCDRLLALILWRGDETVLDVGCGRGLLLFGAAKFLTSGKSVGIDVWSKEDLSGNRPEAARENAALEKGADRGEVKDGDARQLPFADGTFDVIVSRVVEHNIYDAAQRKQAVRGIARVLKPGGYVALLDILHTGESAKVLQECGLTDVRRVGVRGPLSVLTFGIRLP